MPATLSWDGLPAFDRAVLAKIERQRVAARAFVEQGAHLAESAMKRRAREGGRHSRGTRTPASRGGGPAVISGDLGRSIRVGPIRAKGRWGYETSIGPTMIYSRAVELKYKYPYTRPGWADTIPRLRSLQRTIFSKAA